MRRPWVVVTPSNVGDVKEFGPLIRQSDRDELEAASAASAEAALFFGITKSTLAWSAHCTEGPLCIFGIAPTSVLTGAGVPWFMATDLISKYQFTFLRHSKHYVTIMRQHYPIQVNYVDDRHLEAQRWLKWLGYTLGPPEPYGVYGLPFRQFSYRESQGCVTQNY
jgi:hypothetical protein